MRKLISGCIWVYRYCISPYLGSNCRYYPSCSCYAQESVERFGAFKGSWMAIKRILRCHPWHEGGFDPVPECETHTKKTKIK